MKILAVMILAIVIVACQDESPYLKAFVDSQEKVIACQHKTAATLESLLETRTRLISCQEEVLACKEKR